jgi:serine/threonine-protein kinase
MRVPGESDTGGGDCVSWLEGVGRAIKVANRAMPRAGDVVAGKYRIEEVIGEGGMGAVYAASHTVTGKRIALKWMLPELAADQGAVQRFIREAQAAGRIDHPNVVDVYDVGEHDGSTFLVMEYLQGETLTVAFSRGELEPQKLIRLLIPAMRGVAAAHQMGVIHRDLKPDNVFLCRNPEGGYREPKVLDFGISKVSASDGQLNPRLTRTGAVMGTPYYMSPEQIRGATEVDVRTDVYAFGVILYEALTGRVPFDANTYSALVLEIATGTPRRPRELRPDLPKGLEDVVLKAMARDADDRYPSVESLARALEPYADGATFADRGTPAGAQRALNITTTPFVSDGPVQVPVRRGSIGLVIGSLSVAVAGILAWALVGNSDDAGADRPPTSSPAVLPPAPSSPHAAAAGHSSAPRPAPLAANPAAHPEKNDAGVKDEPVPGAPAVASGTAPSTPAAVAPSAGDPGRGRGEPGAPHDRQQTRRRSHLPPDAVQPVEAGSRPTAGPARSGGRTGTLRSDEF